jgi:hypothetical protein
MQTRGIPLLALTLASLLSLLSLLALAACGGGTSAGLSATATPPAPTPTATPLVNTLYTSADGAYSVKYPATWTTKAQDIPSTSGAVAIASPDNNDAVLVEPFTFRSTNSAQHILKAAIAEAPFSGSKVDDATTSQTYPSGTWTVATGSTTVSGATTALSVRLYKAEHGGHTVIIITFAPAASAAADQTKYFDPMLASFTFLK